MLMPATADAAITTASAPVTSVSSAAAAIQQQAAAMAALSSLTTATTVTPAAPVATAAPASVGGQKDTTWTKLFVGGLPYHTTDKSLREHFEVYGDIEEAVVITDRQTGKSRGYGFVIMSTKESAERACKEPNPIIDGRKANVNLAILGAKPRGNALQGLSLTALQRFPTLLPGQFGDLTSLANAAQLGMAMSLPSAATAAIAAQAAATSPVTAAALQAAAAANSANAGGKARSSMSLQLLSGRLPTSASATTNPYLQSMYAASVSPYTLQQAPSAGFLQMAGAAPATAATTASTAATSTGNPLLDAYAAQYAALAAAGYAVNPAAAALSGFDASAFAGASYLPQGYTLAFPTATAAATAVPAPTPPPPPPPSTPRAPWPPAPAPQRPGYSDVSRSASERGHPLESGN